MGIKRLLVIPTVLSLALASSFVFAADTESKAMTATFTTKDGKQIRCQVHPDDKSVVSGLKKGDDVMTFVESGGAAAILWRDDNGSGVDR